MGTVKDYHEMVCPSCGSDESLDVVATVWVRLTPDGSDAALSQDGSHEWDNDSFCCCNACDWNGRVVDATYFGKVASA